MLIGLKTDLGKQYRYSPFNNPLNLAFDFNVHRRILALQNQMNLAFSSNGPIGFASHKQTLHADIMRACGNNFLSLGLHGRKYFDVYPGKFSVIFRNFIVHGHLSSLIA